MKNTLNQGFTQLYTANESYLPPIQFKDSIGDFKRAIESTTDQITDIDPISTTSIDSPDISKTDVSDAEPVIKEDTPTIGETIISDAEDEITLQRQDSAPAGTDPSPKITDVSSVAGVSAFSHPLMDDFLGETEGTDEEEKKDKETHPDASVESLCHFLINDPLNAKNVEHMEEASVILSKTFSKVYSDLRTELKSTIDKLTAEVHDATESLLNQSGTVAIASALQVTPPTVEHINWNVLSHLGSSTEIIADAKRAGHIGLTNVMNFTAARATTARWVQSVESTDIPDAIKNAIISKINIQAVDPLDAGIDSASNPDTPEGQVAAGAEYLKAFLSGDILTDGTDEATPSEDKQTHAHTPEEAFKEAQETFSLMHADRVASGGIRDANEKIYTRYTNLLEKFQDTSVYALPTPAKAQLISSRIDPAYLQDEDILFSKSHTFALFNFFKENRLTFKDLAVKLKNVLVQKDQAYLNAISAISSTLMKSLSAILNIKKVHPVTAIEQMHALAKPNTDHSWSLKDIATVKQYDAVCEMYAAYMKDIVALHNAPKFGTKEANDIFNLGYYTLEAGVAIFSALQAITYAGLSSLTKTYRRGLQNTAEKQGIESLLQPRMDDFLTEEEDAKKTDDPKENALDEEVDSRAGESTSSSADTQKNTTTPKENIAEEVYRTIATQAGYYRFIKTMERAMHARDTGRQISTLLRVIDKYPRYLDAFMKTHFDISDKDAAILKQNAQTVHGVLSCVGLYLIVCRDYFNTNQVLILDESHVNPSVLPEFHKQDGKDTDIELHLLHQYILPKRPVPNMGIRISDVTRSAKRISEEYDQKVSSMKQQLKINKDSALQATYSRVLDKYLKNTPKEKLPTGMTLRNFVATHFNLVNITARNLLDKNHSVDECIAKFLIQLWYDNKPIYKDMYNKFEYRYRQLADTSIGTITPRDKATADAKVIADMAMNFLFDHIVQQ